MIKPAQKIFLFVILMVGSTSLYAQFTTDSIKTYMTTCVEARLGDMVPAPIGLAYELGKASPQISKVALLVRVNKLQGNAAINLAGPTARGEAVDRY